MRNAELLLVLRRKVITRGFFAVEEKLMNNFKNIFTLLQIVSQSTRISMEHAN